MNFFSFSIQEKEKWKREKKKRKKIEIMDLLTDWNMTEITSFSPRSQTVKRFIVHKLSRGETCVL